jgi:hypothetical protein
MPRSSLDLVKKLALALGSFILTAAALEAAARAGLPIPAPVLFRDRIYLNSLPLVNGRLRFQPSVPLDGPPLSVRKEPGEVRIFIFGESSAEGIPWGPAMSAPTFLYDRLQGKTGDTRVTVVNMGRASAFTLDAYYYLLSIRRYRPDIIIFYAGMNNRYDVEPELCLPANHPHAYSAWRWLVERSQLLCYLRTLGPRMLSRPSGPGTFSRMGEPRCDAGLAFSRWADILLETAAATGARVIVTAPVENALKKIDYDNSRDKAGLSPEAFFAQLDPGYRSLLVCLMRSGDLAQALRQKARPQAPVHWHPDYRPLADCLRRPDCDPAAALWLSLQPLTLLAWRLGGNEPPSSPSELSAIQDAWRRSAARTGAGFIDFARFLEERTPGGLLGPPYIVDEVHLFPEGYWLLAGLWQEKISGLLSQVPPPSRDLTGLDLGRYQGQLRSSMGDILLFQGLVYLDRKMPLLALPMIKLAAQRYHNRRAARIIRWLTVQAGADASPADRARASDLLEPGDLSAAPPPLRSDGAPVGERLPAARKPGAGS